MESIKKRRQKEISEGKNAGTRNPLYVVYDQIQTYCEHDTSLDQSTTVFNHEDEFVRFDSEGNEKKAEANPDNWGYEKGKWSAVVKKSFHDRFVTVCFTRKGAEDFIKAERHNLNKPRIYVEYAERRNIELHEVLKALGD